MKRKRFTEEQIIGVLKEHELGAKTADLCRKHGISEATLYNWKSKFGGMEVSEAKRLKQLADEKGSATIGDDYRCGIIDGAYRDVEIWGPYAPGFLAAVFVRSVRDVRRNGALPTTAVS
jgi:putative transposase